MSDKLATSSLKYWEIVGQRQYFRDIQARAKLFRGQYKAEIGVKEVVGTKTKTTLQNFLTGGLEQSVEHGQENCPCPVDHQRPECESHSRVCNVKIYELATSSNVGQVPVARYDLGADSIGNIILEEDPLVVLPQIPTVGECVVCIDCCRPVLSTKYNKCSKCFWPVCKDACDQFVSLHTKEECDILALGKSACHWKLCAGYECLWMIRVLLQKKLSPEAYKRMMNIETREIFLKQNEVMPGRYYAMEILRCTYAMDEKNFSDKELIQTWNLLRLKLLHSCTSGRAVFKRAKVLYSEGSMFLHSCVANIAYETDPVFKLRLFLQRPVSAGDPLNINYDPESIFQPTRSRQIRFMHFHKFRCLCIRCEDPTELGTFYSGIPCHSVETCEDPKDPGFLLQKDPTDPGSKWECFKCQKVELMNMDVQFWLFSITNGLEECLKRQEPEELNLIVRNIVEQQLLHETHFIIFEYFVETLKLLSQQLENDPSMGTTWQLMKYWQAARCVCKISRIFLPPEVSVLGPVLRMCVLIKIAGLITGFEKKCYNLSRVKQDLERYVLKVEENGNVVIRSGPLIILQEGRYDSLDRGLVISLANYIEKYDMGTITGPVSSQIEVIKNLKLYASYLKTYLSL